VVVDHSWYVVNQTAQPGSPPAHGMLTGYATWVGMIALVGLLVIGWLRGRDRLDAPHASAVVVLTGLSAVIAVILNHTVLAPLVGGARHCHADPQVQRLLTCARHTPTPGDHAVIVGALAAGLLVLSRRLGGIAVGLVLLLALGRVYIGVQNPSDTAVGLAFGAIIALSLLSLTNCVSALAHRLGRRRAPGIVV
jgi:undecaprenyl-diphosphatase